MTEHSKNSEGLPTEPLIDSADKKAFQDAVRGSIEARNQYRCQGGFAGAGLVFSLVCLFGKPLPELFPKFNDFVGIVLFILSLCFLIRGCKYSQFESSRLRRLSQNPSQILPPPRAKSPYCQQPAQELRGS